MFPFRTVAEFAVAFPDDGVGYFVQDGVADDVRVVRQVGADEVGGEGDAACGDVAASEAFDGAVPAEVPCVQAEGGEAGEGVFTNVVRSLPAVNGRECVGWGHGRMQAGGRVVPVPPGLKR